MKKIYNYTKFEKDSQNDLVETFNTLCDAYMAGKSATKEYKETNEKFNYEFMKECYEAIPNVDMSKFSLEVFKNPMVNEDMFMLHRFNTILAQMITPVVPTVVAAGFENLYDVTQVGWGDNAKYFVESNEMFIVSSNAIGIARGGVQTTYNTEYTVRAQKKEVAAYVDWYHVASGKQDWGRFGIKLGLAYAAYIEGLVVRAMSSSITDADIPKNQGISGYIVNGFSDDNWVRLARAVQLANGGSQVYALGTKISLAKVLPAETANSQFRYLEDSAIIKTGYLPAYKGVPLIELGNALIPNTINGYPEVIVGDNIIYMIPMNAYKPVKVVFEGNTLTVNKNPLMTADHTYQMIINLMVGADVIVGSKYGGILLS